MKLKIYILLPLLLFFITGFTQTPIPDVSKTIGFAHFTGTYGNETAQLEIL
ncbi:MAG: hypothetical protein WAU24_02645 [Chitinophagaceae bacterium]